MKWTWKGLIITPNEWHMLVCGLGDGFGWRKAEKIPSVSEFTEEQLKDETNFYAILAQEAWYYKIAFGIGRLAWGGIIYAVVCAI